MSNRYQPHQDMQPEIRDTVSMNQILFKQILVCEAALSNPDINPDNAIDALFHILPSTCRQAVLARMKEYKLTRDSVQWRSWAGVRQGSVEHPMVNESGEVISPIVTKGGEYIDYRALYGIVIQELENAKLTYKYDSIAQELGKVKEVEVPIPNQTLESIKMDLDKYLQSDTETGSKYTLYDLLLRILSTTPLPETPLLEDTEESIEEEVDQV